MKNKKIRCPFKIHGGKFYLSEWIISHFPENYQNYIYVEPYVGAGSIFINKMPSTQMEIINDIDPGVVQIFKALRDEPDHFIDRLKKIKYSEKVFNRELKKESFDDYMDHAVREFILRRMSRGGIKKAFGWSERLRGGIPGDVNAWKTIIKELPYISDRLKNVKIFNKSAIEVISAFDNENTLIYADPPYPEESRSAKNVYEFEMTNKDHEELAEELMKFRGKAIISGYGCPLFERLYGEWRCVKKKIANHSSQQKSKKIMEECLWINF